MSNLLGGEQSMLEKLMAAQERIAELEAAALEIRADCNAVVCGKSDRITELEAEVARLRVDGATLWEALNDLSFECYGGIGPTSPTIKTYNRTFGVMDSMREKYAAKESA